jgi:hypothetical protein
VEGGKDGFELRLTELYDLAEIMCVALILIGMVGLLCVLLGFLLAEIDGSLSAFSFLLLFL